MSTTNFMNNEIARTEYNGIRELTSEEIQAVSGGYKIETAIYAIGLSRVVRRGQDLVQKERYGLLQHTPWVTPQVTS